MKIIPVIDIKEGIAVSAQQGQRHLYQPIQSKLCHSSSVTAVLDGFLSIYPFKTVYLADLNAITTRGNNQSIIDKIVTDYPAIEFWVDKGQKIQNLPTTPIPYCSVIGSENQDMTKYDTPIPKNHILSLDFFPEQGYKGPKNLLENSLLWPNNIIIMTLNRVGTSLGPDFEKLKSFSIKYPKKNFIAAGGVRNTSDLLALNKAGIDHALIASALHSGMISSKDIHFHRQKNAPNKRGIFETSYNR